MDNIKSFELKVGIFMLIGIAILFLIVFSIGDINLSRAGYRLKVLFNFIGGVTTASPVRVSGVNIGQVQSIKITKDKNDNRTKAEVTIWVDNKVKLEEDSGVCVNTLGLLGEKYIEITPGTPGARILNNNDTLIGKDPVIMDKVTENLAGLSESIKTVVDKLNKGEGTVGKLLAKDEVYDDVKAITSNFKEFSADIRKHPWKLLNKPRGED